MLKTAQNDVYVRPGNEIAEQLHATMVEKGDAVLQEATSQLPSETPMEDVTLPEDVGFQIMTEVLDQKYDGCLFFQIDHRRGQRPEGGSDSPKRSACNPGQYDCTGLSGVRSPNPAAST
ncbi:hypothetical protein D8674_026322 [Pyrus ussuriensis x Pyrus communis]|uniref:Uncharacterized protein n=1 Tax=Pyrus ussuriensis x Pyrus communis TaxID=2448454 RepID=A0A5N5I7L4_9ROSA|nr:hypothetical protein D8674_026322 [Pyrus ussuriensis x Pyrus communis]